MRSKTLRAATVGCGRMGAFQSKLMEENAPPFWLPVSHLAALEMLSGVEIVACCDVFEEARERAMDAFGLQRSYAEVSDLLANEDIDILTIATRTPEKTDIIVAALEAGVSAIHIEKPLCNSVAELEKLRPLLETTTTHVTFGALRRFLPPYQMVFDHTRLETFGPITDIRIEMGHARLMWTLVHGLDTMLFLAGEAKPIAVQAWLTDATPVDDQPNLIESDPKIVSATILFDNDITGNLGRTSGAGVTVSSADARIEAIGDGQQIFASALNAGGVYQSRVELAAPATNVDPGGSLAPLLVLRDALYGDPSAIEQAKRARTAIVGTQDLIFDMLHSHLLGGQVVTPRLAPKDLCIMGMSDGKPA